MMQNKYIRLTGLLVFIVIIVSCMIIYDMTIMAMLRDVAISGNFNWVVTTTTVLTMTLPVGTLMFWLFAPLFVLSLEMMKNE